MFAVMALGNRLRQRAVCAAFVAIISVIGALALTVRVAAAAPVVSPTPPMGWNPWYAYGCGATEALVEENARLMVADGFAAAGYRYVNVDDCWMSAERAPDGELQADPTTFPDGIAALASYVHGLGLKLGIYIDAGTATCEGRPGSAGHYAQDAQTLAGWGVDFVKVDYCNTGLPAPQPVYRQIYNAFAAVPRPMVLSVCEWGFQSPWVWADHIGTMWRTAHDYTAYGAPENTWKAMLQIVNLNAGLARFAHPGAWNDPDMLLVGTHMLSYFQERAQVSLWSMMASPLLMDADLQAISQHDHALLTNPEVLAVDQDSAGIQGTRAVNRGALQIWVRPLHDGSRAVLFFNSGALKAGMSLDVSRLGINGQGPYYVHNLWQHTTSITSGPLTVPVRGADVVMVRVTPMSKSDLTSGGVSQ
jgi:alpha-galactosidase